MSDASFVDPEVPAVTAPQPSSELAKCDLQHSDAHTAESVMLTEPPGTIYTPKRYTDEALYAGVKTLLKSNRKPPTDRIAQMSAYVNRELPNAIHQKQYAKAAELEQASKLLFQFTAANSEYNRGQKKRQAILARLDASKQQLREVRAVWDAKIKEAQDSHAQKLCELEDLHKAEKEQFDEDWRDPDYLFPFHKPSGLLLQLRDAERMMGLGKDFAGAEVAAQKAKALELEEVESQRAKARFAMKKQFDTMKERHQKEMDCLVMRQTNEIKEIERAKLKELHPYEIQIAVCQTELKENKDKEAINFARKWPTRVLHNDVTIHTLKPRQMLDIGGIQMGQCASARRQRK
jgi:hypothetical protein